jgi:hypothetical protein
MLKPTGITPQRHRVLPYRPINACARPRDEGRTGLRLVCVTGIGAGDSAGHGGFLFDSLIFPLLLRKVYADRNRQEAIVREIGLDWVLVRPSVLNDKRARGTIRALTDLSGFHGGAISREDVASFVLDQ